MPRRIQRGFSLIETLIAMGILSAIGVVFLGALFTNFRSVGLIETRATAENLVRTQLDSIHVQSYFVPPSVPYLIPPGNDPGAYSVPPSGVLLPSGYTLTVELNSYCDVSGCYPTSQIQQITLRVSQQGKALTSLSDLRSNR